MRKTDKQRIDWLEEQGGEIDCDKADNEEKWLVATSSGHYSLWHKTLRQAVDYAMKSKPSTGGK